MIASIAGKVTKKLPGLLVVDLGGIAYEVLTPLRLSDACKVGTQVKLLTHLHVSDSAHTLYGFENEADRELFRAMVAAVSGVGPKLALSLLGSLGADEIKRAIAKGEISLLSSVKGVGQKTAQRLILELKSKLPKLSSFEAGTGESLDDGASNDAFLALISLGYKKSEVEKALSKTRSKATAEQSIDEIIRECLRHLN